MARRFTIHPPYLANRGWLKGDSAEKQIQQLQDSFDSAMQELSRWLRYATNANDFTQVTLGDITSGSGGGLLNARAIHAKIMIRVSLDF